MEKAIKAQPRQQIAVSWAGLLNLFVVYVVWGSTYLAIRVAVRQGAGFPPFALATSRVLIAGSILMLWSAISRQRIKPTKREFVLLVVSGVLLWFGGNGLVSWAEQRTASGLTALIIGSTPIWVAGIEAVVDRRPPSWILVVSLLIGFAGIGLLSAPVLIDGVRADMLSVIGLLLAALSWGSGSLLQSRNPVTLAPTVSSAYQHLCGGVALGLTALLRHEPLPTPTAAAWTAWGYLVIIGSVFAFTSFVRALRLLPTSLVMTYAYVNPVIAVILGWAILHESITGWTIAGSALVLIGVAGVFRARSTSPR